MCPSIAAVFGDGGVSWVWQSPQPGLCHTGGLWRARVCVLQPKDVNKEDNQVQPPEKQLGGVS